MGQPNRGIYKPRKVNPVRDQIMAALDKEDATVTQLALTTGRNKETIFNHVHEMLRKHEIHLCAWDSTHSGPPARKFRLGPRPPGFIPDRIASPQRNKAPVAPTAAPASPPVPWTPPPPQHPIIAALFKGKTP